MIQKPQTSEIMDILSNSINNLKERKDKFDLIVTKLKKTLSIINTVSEKHAADLLNLAEKTEEITNKIILSKVESYGNFDSFGIGIHPKLLSTPRDIFNFRTTSGYIFKDNMTVTINGTEDIEFKQSLKNDSIEDKQFDIKEYSTDKLSITIEPNAKNRLGSLNFNVLEIVPYLNKTFNIEEIRIYSKENLVSPNHSISGLVEFPTQRIILDDKVELGKIEFDIKLLYKNNLGKYPFGFKHLYFLDCDFDRDDSYIIVKSTQEDNLTYIYKDIIIKNQFGVDYKANCEEENISFYTAFNGDTLSHEIELSTDTDPSYITTNTRSCYIFIPVKTGMISIIPNISTKSLEN